LARPRRSSTLRLCRGGPPRRLLRRPRAVPGLVEATACDEGLLERVEPLAQRVVLAHPGKRRVIAERTRKRDKLDARVLAEFLALDMIPPAYRPTPRQREHRARVRHRQFLPRKRTQRRNKIRRLGSDSNPDRRDLVRRRGREALRAVPLNASDQFIVAELLEQVQALEQPQALMRGRMRACAADGPPHETRGRQLLRSVPGVGAVTSEVVLAEWGDVGRFRSAKPVVADASSPRPKTTSAALRWVSGPTCNRPESGTTRARSSRSSVRDGWPGSIHTAKWLDAGLTICGSSNHMIRLDAIEATNPWDPWLGLWVAMTQQTEGAGVLNPDQRLTRAKTIRFDTINNARLHFEEREKGSIERGKLADLILVDRDPLTCPEDDLKTTQVAWTMVGGKRVDSQSEGSK
jgi:Amidohydrolase family/Transposase IS116/IS110/IS902 family